MGWWVRAKVYVGVSGQGLVVGGVTWMDARVEVMDARGLGMVDRELGALS